MYDNRNGLHYSADDNAIYVTNVRLVPKFSVKAVDDYSAIVWLKRPGARMSGAEFMAAVELHEKQTKDGIPWHVELRGDYLELLDRRARRYETGCRCGQFDCTCGKRTTTVIERD